MPLKTVALFFHLYQICFSSSVFYPCSLERREKKKRNWFGAVPFVRMLYPTNSLNLNVEASTSIQFSLLSKILWLVRSIFDSCKIDSPLSVNHCKCELEEKENKFTQKKHIEQFVLNLTAEMRKLKVFS